jgi:hypothetical protein
LLRAPGIAPHQVLAGLELAQPLRPGRVGQGADPFGAEARVHRPEHQHVGRAQSRERGVADHVHAIGAIIRKRRAHAQPDGRAGVHGHPAPEPDLGVQLMGIEAVLDEVQAALDFDVGQV